MFGNLVSSLVVFAVMASSLLASEKASKVSVGDRLIIKMTGELAKEYSRRTVPQIKFENTGDIQISATAMVSQQLEHGRFQIEQTARIEIDKRPPRLITLSAIIEAAKIEQDVIPKNTPVYGSPADHQKNIKPSVTQNDSMTYRLELSELKSIKLQAWELMDENGN